MSGVPSELGFGGTAEAYSERISIENKRSLQIMKKSQPTASLIS